MPNADDKKRPQITTVFTRAAVPDDLANAWLQHLRDFDIAHPGCHFEIMIDAPDQSLAEMVQMMRVNPALKFIDVIERNKG